MTLPWGGRGEQRAVKAPELPMSWQDSFGGGRDAEADDEPTVLTTGGMADGDTLDLTVSAEPEVIDTNNGDALRVECEFIDSTHGFERENGEPVEQGEQSVLVTWSSRLVRALGDAASLSDGLPGETIRVAKSGQGYDTTYHVTVQRDDSDD